jgi:tetratricopeptide (TPR) repeat protein
MARILVTQQHYAEAIPFLRNALSNRSVNAPDAHALLGKIYAAEGKGLEAIAELKQALFTDRDGSYHYQLYRLYRKMGDEKSAAVALKEFRAIRTSPQ